MWSTTLNSSNTPYKHLRCFTLFCLLAIGIQTTGNALQPIHEADRLIMAAEESIEDNNFPDAERYLQKAGELGIELPAGYDFLYGKIFFRNGDFAKANERLEKYVTREGNEGHYYREALSLITTIEKKSDNNPESISGTPKSEIKWSSKNDSYLQKISRQQGNENLTAALTSHINQLLKQHSVGNRKILAASRTITPSNHTIKTSSKGEVISINQYGSNKKSPIKEDRFPVYGIDPYVSFECPQSTASCWIVHPITEKRWLQITEDKDTASELAKALTQLIRQMQKSG